MSRNVLFTMTLFGLLGGGLLLAGCGEEATGGGSPLPNEGEGENPPGEGEGSDGGDGEGDGKPCVREDKDGDTWYTCGHDCDDNNPEVNGGAIEIADGIDNDCDGEVDGLPPGGDLELCGDGGACLDGYECQKCEDAGFRDNEPACWIPKPTPEGDLGYWVEPGTHVCTCPQIFAGTTWWAEFPEVRRADGQPYDFSQNVDFQFWMEQEVVFDQEGCAIRGPDRQFLWDDGGTGSVILAPPGFTYERNWDAGDNQKHPLRSRGQLSDNHNTIIGTCEGEYPNWSTLTLFNITCTFTLTRRE